MVVFREAVSYLFNTSSYCSASYFSLLNNCVVHVHAGVCMCVKKLTAIYFLEGGKRDREREN